MNTLPENSPVESTTLSNPLPELAAATDPNPALSDGNAFTDVNSAIMPLTENSVDLNAATSFNSQNMGQDLLGGNFDQIISIVKIGGPVVWILIALSVFSLSVIFLKLWQFAVTKPESINDITDSLKKWRNHDPAGAVKALHPNRPVANIIRYAMHGITEQQDQALLQEELSRQANRLVNQLRALLRPLEVIASLSPLLGLMGTVLGMIIAFQQMEAAGNSVNPSVLSGGIWQALLTTAVGLAVAIPVATAHSILERKVERVTMLINDAVTQVFTCPLYQTKAISLSLKEHQRAA